MKIRMSNAAIMVVEDSGIVLLDIQKNLISLGYKVVATASTREEAIRKAEEIRPDLVLMDIRLGDEMGGIVAADTIRDNFNIPVVFLTGYADEDTFQRAKITNPFGYLLKPFDANGLRTTIEVALHNHKLEYRVQKSEQRYRQLVEDIDGIVWESSLDPFAFTYISPRIKQLLGYDPDAWLSSTEAWIGSIHPEDRDWVLEYCMERARAGEEHEFEYRILGANGEVKWLRDIVSLAWENGKVVSLRGVMVDITESKRTESVMLARYRLVSKSINSSASELLQATLDEMEALTGSSIGFFHFVDHDQANLSLQAWSTNTVEKMCQTVGTGLHYPIHKAGVWVDCFHAREPVVHNEYKLLKHRKGLPEGHAEVKRELVIPVIRGDKIVALIGVGNKELEYDQKDIEAVSTLADLAWDIVERKKTETALQESEALYHDLVETAQDLIWQCDREGRYTYLNPAWEQVFGYKLNEMLGRPFTDFQSPEYAKRDMEMFLAILVGEPVARYETVHLAKDGSELQLVFNSKAVPDSLGNILGTRGTAYDITERKRAETALQKSEYLLRESQKLAKLGYYELNVATGVWKSSVALNDLFGIDWDYPADMKGWLDLIHPEDQAQMNVYFTEEVLQKHQSFDKEYRIVRVSDGKTRWVHGLGKLEFDSNGNLISMIGNIQDITDRKSAELAIRESANRYQAVVEDQKEFIVRWKSDGTRTFVNEAYLRYFDLTREEALSSTFIPLVVEHDRPAIEKKIARLLTGEIGSEKDIHRVIRPDGTIGWQEWTDRAILDDDGNIVEFQSVGRDITESRLADEALRMKTEELEALFSISSHLRAAQSADAMLPLVLTEMRRVLHSDANAIILLDPNSEHFTYALGDGQLAAYQGLKFNAENSISGLVRLNRQPYTSTDISSDPQKAPALQEINELGPAVVAPVVSESEFLGVLLCARSKGSDVKPYSDSEVRLLKAIGEMVGNALRRARLFDQALKRMQYLQTLHSIDTAISANLDLGVILEVLLTQGVAQLDVDAACVLLLDPHTHMLEYAASKGIRSKAIRSTRLRLGDGLAGKALIERKVLYFPNLLEEESVVRKYLLEEGFVSYQAAPLIAKGQLQGVLEIFNRKPMDGGEEQTGFLETLATQAAIAIDNSQLFSDLQRSNFELEMAYDATIEGWSRALELRDQETEGHTLRVTEMTLQLAQEIGVRNAELIHIRRGSLLHDIGKMGVPDRILLKPSRLVDDELEIMKQHTVYAFEMLWPIEFLRPAIDIPHYHHERWDGTGYPRKLKGEYIPLSARLFAVADVWDALTSDRPYRKAWTKAKALDYIIKNKGKHFDPQVIELFLDLRGTNDRAVDSK
jgi:PAS domain S-box-containing protein/putative nucleotidyltransferase with HDIG domain